MDSQTRHRVRTYLKTFAALGPEGKKAELYSIDRRLEGCRVNIHAQEGHYVRATKIYLRYLRLFMKVEHKERAHAILSASSASKWMNCTPSARLEDKIKDKSSSYADEGTLAHELAELQLRRQLGLIDSRTFFTEKSKLEKRDYFSSEMEDFVATHVEYILAQYAASKKADPATAILIEERVDITHLIPEGFGTCDTIIIGAGTMEVIDLKYGAGVRVSADNNAQLKLYAAGALEKFDLKYDINKIVLTISQPRMDSISSFELSAEELVNWGENEVKTKAAKAFEGAGEQVVGEWCRFCKASPKCKAMQAVALEATKEDFTDPLEMTDAELVKVYKSISLVSSWFKKVEEFMKTEALEGHDYEGLKLVEGAGRRGWVDEDKAKETLEGNYKRETFINEKLKGIGDIEKLVGKKNFPIIFEGLVETKKAAPSLVPSEDKRPAMVKTADLFDDDDEL